MPLFPTIMTPSSKERIYFGPEYTGWGHAPGTGLNEFAIADLVDGFTDNPQVNTIDNNERTGAVSGISGRERTSQYSEITVTGAHRANGFSGWALALMMGSTSAGFEGNAFEAVGNYGNLKYHSITPAWGHNRVLTKTFWRDLGSKSVGATYDTNGLLVNPQAKDYLQYLASSIKSWSVSWSNQQLLAATAVYDALWPVSPDDVVRYSYLPGTAGPGNRSTTTPGTIKWVGTDYKPTRTRSLDATCQLVDRHNNIYQTHILAGSITINRASSPIWGRQAGAWTDIPQTVPIAPTVVDATSAGSLPAGTYQYAFAYAMVTVGGLHLNKSRTANDLAGIVKNRGGIGPLGPLTSIAHAGTHGVTITIPTVPDVPPPKMEAAVIIFRTRKGGATPYLLDIVKSGAVSYTDSCPDAQLSTVVHPNQPGLDGSVKKAVMSGIIDEKGPLDIQMGDLSVTGTLTVLMEGVLAGDYDTGASWNGPTSMYRDFLDFIEAGSEGAYQSTSGLYAPTEETAVPAAVPTPVPAPWVIQFRDADGCITRLSLYPVSFDSYVIDRTTDQGVIAQVSFTAINDIKAINNVVSGAGGNPGGLTAIRNLMIVNNYASAMNA